MKKSHGFCGYALLYHGYAAFCHKKQKRYRAHDAKIILRAGCYGSKGKLF
jgi:hypothetical protein